MYVLGYDDHGLVHHLMPHAAPLPPSSGVGTPCWIPHTSFLASSLLLSSLTVSRSIAWYPSLWSRCSNWLSLDFVTITTWYFAVWKQITVDTSRQSQGWTATTPKKNLGVRGQKFGFVAKYSPLHVCLWSEEILLFDALLVSRLNSS